MEIVRLSLGLYAVFVETKVARMRNSNSRFYKNYYYLED
jgi:hypothetical protein